jgi:hypothetical protein
MTDNHMLSNSFQPESGIIIIGLIVARILRRALLDCLRSLYVISLRNPGGKIISRQ